MTTHGPQHGPHPDGSRPDQVDPDVDLHIPEDRAEWPGHPVVLGAIALGGMVGASTRYVLGTVWPNATDGIAWTTLGINVVGALLLGALMVVVVETRSAHPLLRPFLGTGVLGGFTTFSTYAVEARGLFAHGLPGLALVYLLGTVLLTVAAAAIGVLLTRRLIGPDGDAAAERPRVAEGTIEERTMEEPG